jgi:N,N'-diacetyllegionaminate synthase
MKTFIIAEAGANHNRSFNQALKLIDVAVEAGANACKFQTYSSETLYVKNVPNFAGYKNINQLIKDIELPREWQKDLKQYCDEKGIEFMSTPFDEKAVDELVALGVKRLKIAGFESTDFRFVEMVASSKLPLVISLGIGFKMNWLGKIFEITDKYGNDLTLMHCNNAYPTPMEDTGLGIVKALSLDSGRYKTGFSDHTISILTPALAVVAGATVIEKHFTLSRHLPGPDHPFALEPDELKEMVENIKQAELTILPQLEEYSESEKAFIKARRSVIAKCSIKKGEIFTKDNITTKRPFLEGCIPASDFEFVLGTYAQKDYEEDNFI